VIFVNVIGKQDIHKVCRKTLRTALYMSIWLLGAFLTKINDFCNYIVLININIASTTTIYINFFILFLQSFL